jgi:ketosteroid isomerase-like protein
MPLFRRRSQASQWQARLALYSRLAGQKPRKRDVEGKAQLIRKTRCRVVRKQLMLILATLAFLLVPCSRAQTSAELRELAKEKEVKQEELVNLEKETARAMQWNNGALFRRVYGEDFVGILPSGQIMDKAGWIATVENSSTKYSSFLATDIRVRLFEETAVVTCLWSSRGTRDGRTFSRQLRVTHVYIYGQRGWQAIASQETLLPG